MHSLCRVCWQATAAGRSGHASRGMTVAIPKDDRKNPIGLIAASVTKLLSLVGEVVAHNLGVEFFHNLAKLFLDFMKI